MDDDPLLGYGLHPVQLTDQARFDQFFRTLSEPLSDYTFAQVFTWGNSLRILWREIRGHLCVFANGTGDLTLLMPPIGEGGSRGALNEAFEIMDAYNAAHNVVGHSRVEYASEELLDRCGRSALAVTPMGTDYLYDVNRMTDLAGGDLASKRQLKNRFLRNYEHRVEAYDPERHGGECIRLLHAWKEQQDSNRATEGALSALKRHKESLACELALNHAQALALKGMVVYVRANPAAGNGPQPGLEDWSLRGFTLGEYLGVDQSSIIIEKTDLSVRGLAQFIFSEFCGRCWSDRLLVNAGDDWGLETLAWTKTSYRPAKLLQKYEFRMAAPVAVAMPVGGRDAAQTAASGADVAAAKAEGQKPAAVVRAAKKEDLSEAVQLEQTCFSVHCLTKRRLQYLQARPSALFLVAEQDGNIVGQGISLVRKHKKARSGRIYSLAVKAEHRGRKIGHKLLNAMIDDLTARGVKRVYLEVEQNNASAVRLYERNGFRSIGVLPDYYGKDCPGVHMVREIEAPAGGKA